MPLFCVLLFTLTDAEKWNSLMLHSHTQTLHARTRAHIKATHMCRQSKSEGSRRVHKLVNNKSVTLDQAVCCKNGLSVTWIWFLRCVCVQMCVCVCACALAMVTRWIIHCLPTRKHLGSREWCSEAGLTSLFLPPPSPSPPRFPRSSLLSPVKIWNPYLNWKGKKT